MVLEKLSVLWAIFTRTKIATNIFYCITAVDRASLISGYQMIGRAARIQVGDSNPSEVAITVLSWLRGQPSWLIVIDNLDDISVVRGLSPENAPQTHTIITIRNPNAIGISAEPLAVPLLTVNDAIDLLANLSNIAIEPGGFEENPMCSDCRKLRISAPHN